ncbi:MAG: glycosyltransferase family 4 protein [Anaerolinea sp.]|nr:glycosyltransferase family 4 protein [Anaerolinea sp.]
MSNESRPRQPMRVAMLLSNAYRPDPRVLKEARSLAGAGYEVTVIAWDREGTYPAQQQTEGFAVQRVQDVRSSYGAGLRQALRLPRFWLAAWRRLSQLRPAVVHCHDFDTLPPGWLWAKLHRRPVIYDAHEYYTELQKPRLRGLAGKVLLPLIAAAEQVLSRTAAAVVTVDERIARRYHNRRVVVIGHYPPMDFARGVARSETGHSIESGHSSEAARSETGHSIESGHSSEVARSETGHSLVYAGRFSTDRGMIVIAEAMQRLAVQGLRPRLRLLGTWTNQGEEQAFWRALAGLEAQVEMLGWVQFAQVPAQLATADLALAVLQPIERYRAALPVKLFEYMACGLPVIISDFPANRAVVAGADCGILVEPSDVDAVAAAMTRLLDDPAEARRLGANGRRAFEERYNWQALERKLLALYAELR